MSNQRQKGKKLQTFWLTEEEKETLHLLAKKAGLNASDFIKRPITEYLAQKPKPKALPQNKSGPFLPRVEQAREPKYLRPDEAAARVSVTPAFIYKLMKQGTLSFHNLGKARLIKVTDLDQLVESKD